MLVTCPECRKRLSVPEGALGRKVRCPACKGVVAVLGRPPTESGPVRPQGGRTATTPAGAEERTGRPDGGMCCARCQAGRVRELPANVFSRRPGYVCDACGALMRPPGTTGTNLFVLLVGGFGAVLGLALCAVAAFGPEAGQDLRMEGALTFTVVGLSVIAWGFYQLRLPEPLNAPARPSRLWLWLLVLLLVLLALGGGVFFFLYFLQEML